MATPVNPFHADLGRGKRRTLPEIEAATRGKGSDGHKAFRRQPVQPRMGNAKVARWLSNQGDSMQLDDPNTLQPRRPNPFFVSGQGHGETVQRPRGLVAHAGAAAALSHRVPHTSASSRRSSSKGLKRSASYFDDSAEDVIYVRTSPIRQPKPSAVVDLTRSNRLKRLTSFSGGRDEDVIIIDPPAAEMRSQLRNLAVGIPRDAEIRSRKRQKQVNGRPAPAPGNPERSAREDSNVEEVVVVAAPEADATETAALIQSVEAVTHFFTLATEIRDKIYRHLLVSPKPIQVQRLWTEPRRSTTRRTRGDAVDNTPLDTKILCVCRRTAIEGTRVLYSENTFLYLLRDPEVVDPPNAVTGRRSQRFATKAQTESGKTIDLEKYGHLIRHMAIELEPNRTTTNYEKLMSAALETLIPAGIGLPLLPSPPRPPCGPIHLHTLTITISPLFGVSQRTVRAPAAGNQDVVIREGRFLSTVGFFSRGAPVLKALQRVNVDFLRINVHVNSDLQIEDDEGEDDDDDSDLDGTDSESERPPQPRRHHLETTIDLRCLPRHLEALSRESQLWANDALMQEKRRQQGAEAEAKLASLRRHIEDACLRPEQALREKFWEEHGAAERRRREQRAKEERRFNGDAYDAQVERGGGEDGRIARGMKSLIISIDRVGDGLRAYRA